MQKLTLLVEDDLYEALHRQVGRGKISHFVSEKVRPYLKSAKTGKPEDFFGCLKKYARPVTKEEAERLKSEYFRERWAHKMRNSQ